MPPGGVIFIAFATFAVIYFTDIKKNAAVSLL